MPRFRVTQDYAAAGVGPLEAGTEVELDDELARWVNRDSPGTLAPLEAGPPAPAPEPPPPTAPPADRAPRRPRADRQRKGSPSTRES